MGKFKEFHRKDETSFTRDRILTFPVVMILILQKSIKSIQLILNEMCLKLDCSLTVSNSAFTQARMKLNHTAFIELNKKAVVDVMYSDNTHKKYKGMRVLAVDGSQIMLPHTQKMKEEFGEETYTNGKGKKVIGSHIYGLGSVLYDVLNQVALDSILTRNHTYEVDLAIRHLEHTSPNDLLLFDRNYTSYRHMSLLAAKNRKFVMRCSRGASKEAVKMFNPKEPRSKTHLLSPNKSTINEIKKCNLPVKTKVRFVRVQLRTGEYEVLATNLFDEEKYPADSFLDIYNLRWGIETFYSVLKTRLGLENFSGTSVESVYQDFYSMIFLSGLETILTIDTNESLAQKDTINKQKVNRAVSFNAIKNQAFEILFSKKGRKNIDKNIEMLEKLFRVNLTQERKGRSSPRIKRSPRAIVNYYKRKKKATY